MKKLFAVVLGILSVTLLLPGLGDTTAQALAGITWFQNNPISIFGDPELSRVYVGNGGINLPSEWGPSSRVMMQVNLTIPDPQSIQFFVNGSAVTAYLAYGNSWDIQYPFQGGGSYTLSVRVTYPTHHNNYNCGTCTGYQDIIVPVE